MMLQVVELNATHTSQQTGDESRLNMEESCMMNGDDQSMMPRIVPTMPHFRQYFMVWYTAH